MEHLESRLGQGFGFSAARQETTDGLGPQGGQVMAPMSRPVDLDFGADLAQDLRLTPHVTRSGCVHQQPGLQSLLGSLDDGPNRPQGVIKVQGYCTNLG